MEPETVYRNQGTVNLLWPSAAIAVDIGISAGSIGRAENDAGRLDRCPAAMATNRSFQVAGVFTGI